MMMKSTPGPFCLWYPTKGSMSGPIITPYSFINLFIKCSAERQMLILILALFWGYYASTDNLDLFFAYNVGLISLITIAFTAYMEKIALFLITKFTTPEKVIEKLEVFVESGQLPKKPVLNYYSKQGQVIKKGTEFLELKESFLSTYKYYILSLLLLFIGSLLYSNWDSVSSIYENYASTGTKGGEDREGLGKGKGREYSPQSQEEDLASVLKSERAIDAETITQGHSPQFMRAISTANDWKNTLNTKYNNFSESVVRHYNTFKTESDKVAYSPSTSELSDPGYFTDSATTEVIVTSQELTPKPGSSALPTALPIDTPSTKPVPIEISKNESVPYSKIDNSKLPQLPPTKIPLKSLVNFTDENLKVLKSSRPAVIEYYTMLKPENNIEYADKVNTIIDRIRLFTRSDNTFSVFAAERYLMILDEYNHRNDIPLAEFINDVLKLSEADLKVYYSLIPIIGRQKDLVLKDFKFPGQSNKTWIVNTIFQEMAYLLSTDKKDEFYSKAIDKWNTRYNLPTLDKQSTILLNSIDVFLMHKKEQHYYLYNLLKDIKYDEMLYNFYNYHCMMIPTDFITNHKANIKQCNSYYTKKLLYVNEVRPKKFPPTSIGDIFIIPVNNLTICIKLRPYCSH